MYWQLIIIFVHFIVANGQEAKLNNMVVPSKFTRDVFSYFWMTEEAKYKLFVQGLIDEFQRKLEEERELELEKKKEVERKLYNKHLASRIKGSILKDFLTIRY